MTKQAVAHQLDHARRILSVAATDEDTQAQLATVGYDAAAIAQGQALYDAAIAARTARHAARGDQRGATADAETLRKQVQDQVSALTQIARAVFSGNRAALETLGLRTGERIAAPAVPVFVSGVEAAATATVTIAPPRPRRRDYSQAALLDRARTVYDAALADATLLAELERVGYPRQRLERERADITALEARDTTQERSKATAKARTAEQEAALNALNAWIARFSKIVRAALRNRPDVLDKLGL